MGDEIGHECGFAFLRLLKPPAYYLEKYGTSNYIIIIIMFMFIIINRCFLLLVLLIYY